MRKTPIASVLGLCLSLSVVGHAEPADHGAGSPAASQKAGKSQEVDNDPPPTPLVKSRIERMIQISDGKVEAPAKDPQKDSAPFLRRRSDMVDEIVAKIKAGYDNGKLEAALEHSLLIDNESYTSDEHDAVFKDGSTDIFATLTPAEKKAASLAYTKARKLLRLKLLTEVQRRLEKDTDPRSQLMAEAVKETIPASQNSYDLALEHIREKNLVSPICFTCGEPVALETKEYDFYTAMGDAARSALEKFHLATKEKSEKIKPPFFDPERKFYTFDGKRFYGKDGTTHDVGVDKGTVTYSGSAEKPRPLNPSRPVEKVLNQLRVDYLNHPKDKPMVLGAAKPSPASPTLGAKASLPSGLAPEVEKFLGTAGSLPQGQTLASAFPTADKMAAALNLLDSSNQSYLTHKNNHWTKGAGASEFGVKIEWARIDQASPEEKKRVMNILRSVRDGQISDYKVVNGNVGYCLWCNLRNDPESVKRLNEFPRN